MVTDRVSTAGFIILLSHIYTPFTLMFVALVILDIASHWFHVLSVSGHHKSKESLEGRIFIMRWFYGIYPFFAYCCVGTEFFYISLYAYHHFPEPWLYTVYLLYCHNSFITPRNYLYVDMLSSVSSCMYLQADGQYCSADFSMLDDSSERCRCSESFGVSLRQSYRPFSFFFSMY
jgi:phosphatidylglycerophosphate synthase